MKRVIPFFLAVLVVLFIGWQLLDSYIPQPPQPSVMCDGQKIPAVTGSYNWKTWFKGICVDTIDPPGLVADIPPTVVPAGSGIDVNFSCQPNDIRYRVWGGNRDWQQLQDGTITIPVEAGVYIYEIIGSWEEGQASYAFNIEAER